MKITTDKVEHFCSAFVAGFILVLAGALLRLPAATTFWGACSLTSWAGIAKECADSRDPEHHTADPWDALASAVGGCLGALALTLALR